jgi:ubiquinone/menaquinone biosynthesis C-methylase UbiE
MAIPRSGARWRRRMRDEWTRGAESWERWESHLLYALAAIDAPLVRALELRPGHRVLDFACGSGEPSLTLARFVAPRGSVLGLDIAGPMIEIARRRARSLGIANATFRRGDVATARLPGPRFDRIVSRFGLMFVHDVPATLARLRAALKPGGRIALAVWGPAERNPYFSGRTQAILPFLAGPPPDPETVPDPLRLARRGLMPRLLRRAGFEGVRAQGATTCFVYRDEEEYLEMTLGRSAQVGDLYRRLPRAKQRALRARLLRAIRPWRSGGVLRCPAFAWVVSGRR